MNAARRAMEQLQTWPDLTGAPASCGTGLALQVDQCEIVHFHDDRSADLHLTVLAIRHLAAELERSTAIRVLSSSPWVTVRLDCATDADVLLSLTSVALQAHSARSGTGSSPQPPCNLHRVTIRKGQGG
ncbi:luciferase family protein [Streptomyces sporangiiformans]|uniref:Luciferase domain-containing protein n=1 Tax=Streptomyces sporangiiformans TaxID=2315329 RepID=A0A505DRC5_9ACTN|nr:luciferase family protein [Streptomyces sporangiiformans]TPQ23858.1 hypothetical protein FGD71_001905 [Streptomyces sporangiiformans]